MKKVIISGGWIWSLSLNVHSQTVHGVAVELFIDNLPTHARVWRILDTAFTRLKLVALSVGFMVSRNFPFILRYTCHLTICVPNPNKSCSMQQTLQISRKISHRLITVTHVIELTRYHKTKKTPHVK